MLIFRIFALFATELELFDFNLCVNLYHFTVLLAPVYAFYYYYSIVDVCMILCRAVTQSGYANGPCHLLLNKKSLFIMNLFSACVFAKCSLGLILDLH